MVRSRFSLCLGLLLLGLAIAGPGGGARADDESGFHSSLALQQAMVSARACLFETNEPHKAVATLEQHLAKVNGNAKYLQLLRDAYRAYIMELALAGQSAQAQRYLDRLCILDPAAANDPTLRPQQVATKPAFPPTVEATAEPKKAKVFPNFALTNPFAKKPVPATAPLKPVVRAQAADTSSDDPFDPSQRRPVLASAPAAVAAPADGRAQELLGRAEAEFATKNYAQARVYFEQAYQADRAIVSKESGDRWAYCLLQGVDEALARDDLGGRHPGELQQQVRTAMTIAPKLAVTGDRLLRELGQRQPASAATPLPAGTAAVPMKQLGRNREGWNVVETEHFRVFHHRDDAFGADVARLVETTRATMAKKWFGDDLGPWEPKCEVILHPSAASYTQMTGVPGTSPGHSRIETDPSGGRVVGRRVDIRLDNPGALEAVLPHETTHVVIAGMYGPHHVPRWVDEGVAVLTEPIDKINAHRVKLQECHRDGNVFAVKELMGMADYPQPARIPAFYAQSVILVEFLAAQRGPQVFTQFVRDGLRGDYETALQRHYGWSFADLEQRWTQQAFNGNAVTATSARR